MVGYPPLSWTSDLGTYPLLVTSGGDHLRLVQTCLFQNIQHPGATSGGGNWNWKMYNFQTGGKHPMRMLSCLLDVYSSWFDYNIEYSAFRNIKWVINISIWLARVTDLNFTSRKLIGKFWKLPWRQFPPEKTSLLVFTKGYHPLWTRWDCKLDSGGSRISQEAPTLEVVRQPIVWQKICQKLHESEKWKNLDWEGQVRILDTTPPPKSAIVKGSCSFRFHQKDYLIITLGFFQMRNLFNKNVFLSI